MIKNALYKLNDDGIAFLKENECQIVKNIIETKADTRPMFYSLSFPDYPSIVIMIPLTTIHTESKQQRIQKASNSKGLSKNFYAVGRILKKYVAFKISSLFVVKASMIDLWSIENNPYIIKNKKLLEELNRKTKIMIHYLSSHPERSENNIVHCREKLIQQELEKKSDTGFVIK